MGADSSTKPRRLEGAARLAGGFAYVLLLLLCLAAFAFSLFLMFRQGTAPCDSIHTAEWSGCAGWHETLDEIGISAAALQTYFLSWRLLAFLPYLLLSLLLVWRNGAELRVLLLAGLLLLLGCAGTWFNPIWEWAGGWLADYSAYPQLELLTRLLSFLLIGGLVLFAYMFPDGRFVPRWARWFAGLLLVVLFANSFLPETVLSWNNWPAPRLTMVPFMLFCFVLTVASIIYRYRRRATAVQRQQIKWVVAGLLVLIFSFLLDVVVWTIYPAFTDEWLIATGQQAVYWELFQDTLWYASEFLFAICLYVAVMRNHLWHIDRIINRTLVYGLLTLVLVTVYLALVLVTQFVFVAVTGQESPLAVVVSTLVIAALFNPLRRRIQSLIDRRFYRRNYDAAQALAQFAQAARDEVDLEQLTADLQRIVVETMQPDFLDLWLAADGADFKEKRG